MKTLPVPATPSWDGTVVFMPGETRKAVVISLRRDDRPGSPTARTIRVALQVGGDGYELDTSPEAEVTAEVTVQEPLAVTLHLSTDTVTEAGGVSTVTASLNRPSSEATSVTVTASPVSPTVAGDYALSANRELTIPAGATTSTGRVTIAAVDNDVEAADRRVTVSAAASNSQGVGNPAPVTLTIRNDDELTMALDVSPAAVSEGAGATLVTVTATVTGTTRLGEARTVTVSVTGSDEDAAVDFASVADFEIVVPAGTPGTRSQATFTLTPEDDTVDEFDAVLRVSGRAGNATVTDATLTLTDDDEAPTGIALDVSPQVVSEGAGETPVTVTATVTGDTRFGVARTLTVSVAGSGSSDAVGFAAVADFTVTVPAAAQSGTGTFVLTPQDNEHDEFDETIVVSGRLGELEIAPARMTVTDNDVLSLSVSDIEVLESAGEAEFTLNLSHESVRRIEIGVTFADVTATRGEDYLPNEEPVIFASGERQQVLRVALVDDPDMEQNETFRVTFDPGAGGELSVKSATCTIVDDEVMDERQQKLEYALAAFGRTMAHDLVTAVEDRMWSSGSGSSVTLAGTRLPVPDEAVYEMLQRHVGPGGDLARRTALRELLARSDFQLSLDDEGAGEADGWSTDSLTLWGRGSQSWGAGRLEPSVTTQSEVFSGQLGLEMRLREDTLVGVMLNGSEGEVEFGGKLGTRIEADIISLHPYGQWSPWPGLGTWAMLGYGLGGATLTDSYSTLAGLSVESDIAMTMAAAGGSHRVVSLLGLDWFVGTNGFLARFEADGQTNLLSALEADVWQTRVLLEGRSGQNLGGLSGLSGDIALATRLDGGDAETGMGMEIGGGVAYDRQDLGVAVEASGRMLLSHEAEDLEDAGASLSLRVDPGEFGRGLYLAFAPSWGNASSGVRAMWQDRQSATGVRDGRGLFDPQMRLTSELGYAEPMPTGRGILTSYGAFSSDGGVTRQYRVGRRLELDILSMSLEAERHESAGAKPEHNVWLNASIRF